MSDDTPPTREELEQAEALARALSGEPAQAPEDALEVAALLRYARGADSATALQLARAERAAESSAKSTPERRVKLRAWALGLAVAAALALAYLPTTVMLRAPSAEAPLAQHAPPAMPPVSAPPLRALLDAEAAALAWPETPLAALLAATARQRQARWSQLAQRYGAEP